MNEEFLIIKDNKNLTNQIGLSSSFQYVDEQNAFYFKKSSSKNSSYFCDTKSGIFIFFDGFLTKNDTKNNSENCSKKILDLYIKFGESFFNQLDGFFSFVIFDASKNKIFLVCDHIGSEPLYFVKERDSIVISSNIKQLKNILKITEINKTRVNTFFQFIHAKNNETFFNTIKQVQNGQFVSIEKERIKAVDYLSYDTNKYNHLKSEEEYVYEFKKIFFNSVDSCIGIKSKKFGTALSGGLDSSSITAVASEIRGEKLSAFTATFRNLIGSDLKKTYESNFSKDLANKHNIDHKIVPIISNGAVSYLNSNIDKFDEPDLLINGYIHEEIFKVLQKEEITLFLDGYGGDAVISHGYNVLHELGKNFQFSELFRQLGFLYAANGAKLKYWKSVKEFIIQNHLPDYFHWIYRSNFGKTPQQIVWSKRLADKDLRSNIFKNLIDAYGFYPLKFKNSAKYIHENEMKNRLIGLSVRSIKKLAENYNVDIRFPFLSKSLIELSLSTPTKFKLKDGVNRHIFRESMKSVLPNSIYHRASKSDMSPFSREEISKIEYDEIKNLVKLYCPKLFNAKYIENLFANSDSYMFESFQIYSFIKWLSHHKYKIQ